MLVYFWDVRTPASCEGDGGLEQRRDTGASREAY